MRDARKGTLLAASSALLAASFFIPYKAATGHGAADYVVIALLAPAAVLNSLTTLWLQRRQLRLARIDVGVAALLGLLTISGNVCMTEALARLDAGITSVLIQTQVFFVAAAGWLLLREHITARFAMGAAIAIGGFAVMRAPAEGQRLVSTTGTLLALGAALSFALMHVTTRKFIDRIQPVTVNALRLWIAVAILLALPGRAAGVLELPASVWGLTVAAAFFGPYCARLCIMFAVKYVAASHAALFGLLVPVFAFLLEMVVLGAVPSAVEVAGGAVILAGIALPVVQLARRARG